MQGYAQGYATVPVKRDENRCNITSSAALLPGPSWLNAQAAAFIPSILSLFEKI
jgi:hypothetical protein